MSLLFIKILFAQIFSNLGGQLAHRIDLKRKATLLLHQIIAQNIFQVAMIIASKLLESKSAFIIYLKSKHEPYNVTNTFYKSWKLKSIQPKSR